jgi:amino acid permease
VIGLLVKSTDPRLRLEDGTASSSPFVIAIQTANIKVVRAEVGVRIKLKGTNIYFFSICFVP